MPKRKKNPADPMLLARSVVEAAIGEPLKIPNKARQMKKKTTPKVLKRKKGSSILRRFKSYTTRKGQSKRFHSR